MTKCCRAVTDPNVDPDMASSSAFFPDLTRQSKDYVNHFGKRSLGLGSLLSLLFR